MLLTTSTFVSASAYGCSSAGHVLCVCMCVHACVHVRMRIAMGSSCCGNSPSSPRRRLEAVDWDLSAWRAGEEARGSREHQEGFEVLDMDNGEGWKLLCAMMQYEPLKRISAAQALDHPWLSKKLGLPGVEVSALLASSRMYRSRPYVYTRIHTHIYMCMSRMYHKVS
jgi:serine/threonine protein kinase